MQTLINKNKALLVKYTAAHNSNYVKLHTLIAKLLKDKETFLSMDIDKILDVLYDLGYDTQEAYDEYVRLMSNNVN